MRYKTHQTEIVIIFLDSGSLLLTTDSEGRSLIIKIFKAPIVLLKNGSAVETALRYEACCKVITKYATIHE